MATQDFTTEELATEEWRPVLTWEGRYEVSNLGRVRSMKNSHGTRRILVLRQRIVADGYFTVGLFALERGPSKRTVHQLVAEAFISPRPVLPDGTRFVVNHIDAIKTNNRAPNLEWVTTRENTRHATELGLMATGERNASRLHPERVPRGTANGMSKLTDDTVREIRKRLAAGEFQRSIGRAFGIGQAVVSTIARREAWRHVK